LKLYARCGVPALLALAILLASCGTGGGNGQSADQGENAAPGDHQARGMKHAENHEPGEMKGMDQGSGGTAPGMLMKNGKYSD
jgi:predicted small secreted protein